MHTLAWLLSSPLVILVGSALGLLAFAQIVLRGRVRWLVIGEDNRYSNSKMQLVVWFWTVISSYLAALICRWQAGGPSLVGGVDIPEHLLMLSGLSALTFAGAKQISTSNAALAHSRGLTAKPANRFGPRLMADLLNDDSGHRPDLGDFQMLVVTAIAVTVYLFQITVWLSAVPTAPQVQLPDVDTTVLATFGLGQAAYLAKKYVGDAPVASSWGPTLTIDPPRPQGSPGVVAQPADQGEPR